MKKDTTLAPAIELLEIARESDIPPSQLKKFIELAGQKSLPRARFTELLQSPLYPDLLEAAKLDSFKGVDRTVFRHVLNLPPHSGEDATHRWREQDGIIYFSVTSDGTTGEEWIKRLESKDFKPTDYAKSLLRSMRSPGFTPTDGVTTEIAVLKGMLFKDDKRTTKKIRAEADKRKLTKPNAEVVCLIREKFSDKELKAMGLKAIVAMHEPIKDSIGHSYLLYVSRDGGGGWLRSSCGYLGFGWCSEDGFAFVASPK